VVLSGVLLYFVVDKLIMKVPDLVAYEDFKQAETDASDSAAAAATLA